MDDYHPPMALPTLPLTGRRVEDVGRQRSTSVGRATKRGIDLLIGLPLCVAALPLVAVLAGLIAVHHRVPPFFVHQRLGEGGRPISIPKLRTLPPTTHPYADKTMTALAPRSRLGNVLRRTHLDELPQLYLVPLGRLSLVGPRPRMAAEAATCVDVAYGVERTSVPQGCTGLWQISAGKIGRVSDHPQYDLFYIRQHTLRLDAWILWRTGLQFLGAKPIELPDVPGWTLLDRGYDVFDAAA